MKNIVHLIDNMEFMAGLKDNNFDLAIVDPPYGGLLNLNGGGFTHIRKGSYKGPGEKISGVKYWNDKAPDKKYFDELFRVSKNQIICGGNYFSLPPTRDFVIFEKTGSGDSLFKLGRSQCEYLWTSFNGLSKIFKWYCNSGTLNKKGYFKIHPTQKPVVLYKWLLKNYAKPGQTIFDSHVGSGSIRIACHDIGFDFVGCEKDPEYWQAQEDRYKEHLAKGKELFEVNEYQKLIYKE